MMRFLRAGFALALFSTAFTLVGLSQNITKGFASTYPVAMEGATTASGESYISTEFTACHATLPFNTLVKVTNLNNNKSVIVRINDRYTYRNSRVIDISKAAATEIDLFADINPQVSIEITGMGDALMTASVKEKQTTSTPAKTAVTTTTQTQPVVASTPVKVTTPAPVATTPAQVKTTPSPVTANAGAKKENPDLLSGIKVSLPTISIEALSNLATVSIKYLSMSIFRY